MLLGIENSSVETQNGRWRSKYVSVILVISAKINLQNTYSFQSKMTGLNNTQN